MEGIEAQLKKAKEDGKFEGQVIQRLNDIHNGQAQLRDEFKDHVEKTSKEIATIKDAISARALKHEVEEMVKDVSLESRTEVSEVKDRVKILENWRIWILGFAAAFSILGPIISAKIVSLFQ